MVVSLAVTNIFLVGFSFFFVVVGKYYNNTYTLYYCRDAVELLFFLYSGALDPFYFLTSCRILPLNCKHSICK